MAKNFSATVSAWVRKSEILLEAVGKQATLNLIEAAQNPLGKGGRMRVDTGFLRLSGQVSLTGMPIGPARPTDGMPNEQSYAVSIGASNLGDKIYFGWTAEYARYREAYDGFLSLQLQKWQNIVDDVVRRLQ